MFETPLETISDNLAYAIWLAGLVGWLAVRLPRRRRARRTKVVAHRRSPRERAVLGLCVVALGPLPALAWAGLLPFADTGISVLRAVLAALVFAAFVALFHRAHRELAHNWSVTLELRENHTLVTQGLYAHMRHPMYAAFFLWGLGQALAVPNWFAGWAGLVSVAILFLSRVGEEEAMMRQQFGARYDEYCARTARLLPGIY